MKICDAEIYANYITSVVVAAVNQFQAYQNMALGAHTVNDLMTCSFCFLARISRVFFHISLKINENN